MPAPAPPLSKKRILAICSARVLLFATFMTVAATIPLMITEWGLRATAAGAIVSSFTIGYAASLFAFASLADHFGAKRMVWISAIAAGATSLAFGLLARDWSTAMVLYGLVGLAQGGVYTPLIMVFCDEVAPARLGDAIGWLIASTSVGYATSLAVAGIGIALGGLETAFVLSGMLPAVGTAVLLVSLRPIGNHVHARPTETRLADELIRNRETRLLFTGYVAHSWELLGMWAWIPAFLAGALAISGLEATGATISGAYLSGFLHLFGALSAFTLGRLSDRTGRRPVLVVLAGAAALTSFTIGWLIYAPPVLLVPLAFAYAFMCLGDSPVLTSAISETVLPAYRGAVLAWRGLAGFGVGAAAPLGFGFVFDAVRAVHEGPALAWGLGFATLGLGGVLAFACAAALTRRPGR